MWNVELADLEIKIKSRCPGIDAGVLDYIMPDEFDDYDAEEGYEIIQALSEPWYAIFNSDYTFDLIGFNNKEELAGYIMQDFFPEYGFDVGKVYGIYNDGRKVDWELKLNIDNIEKI